MMDTRLAQSLTSNFKELLIDYLQPIQHQLEDLKKRNSKNEDEIDDAYFLRHESEDPEYCLENETDAIDLIDYIIKKKMNYSERSSKFNLKIKACPSFVAVR